ncbi:CAP domain-containing protein [Nocardioides coralli]|uniref:CAP domain-containing protein n=1 Tax=Nocardioides coralli TaxID=2872154 RepID=UPI001CA39D55|nr:CAP domain-containing protein [Nocardioides coralli]QZY27632.1 CAP domain-containing protein [Nocardioides coralli]
MPPVARLVTTAVLAVVLAVVLGATTTLSANAAPGPHSGKAEATVEPERFEKRVVARINRARARHGLPRIQRRGGCVDGIAERWASRIVRTGHLVHRDQRTTLARCRLAWTGETLVRGSGLTPAMAVRAWLGSPSHRAVLLKRRARWAGLGVRVDGEGRVIGVLNVGDPT